MAGVLAAQAVPGHALQRMLAMGAALVPRAVDERSCRRLLREVEPETFQELCESVGPHQVRQQADLLAIDRVADYPALDELRADLVRLIHHRGREIAGLRQWEPNRVAVQRYHAGSVGITPHLDGKRYRYLVAVLTIEGTAPFVLCRNRAGEVVEQWQTHLGSLVLMRGPGLDGAEDGRPLHTVRGPQTGTRVSVTFRMESAAARAGPDGAYSASPDSRAG